MRFVSKVSIVSLLALCGVFAGGCSKEITITQQPEFWTPELKTVAVVPFKNLTNVKDAGQMVSDSLANALMANGTYRVFNRSDLKTLMDEQDLKLALGANPNSAGGNGFNKFTNVQAILTGTVTVYAATSSRQQKQKQVPYWSNGKQYSRTVYYTHVRNEANVTVTASLIRPKDGVTIYSTRGPIKGKFVSEGENPARDAYGCSAMALDQAVSQLLETFACVRKKVKVKPKDVVKTATEFYDNKWQEKKKFLTTDTNMIVAIRLPQCCDRNRFRIAIVPKDGRDELASKEFMWSRSINPYRGKTFQFSPKDISSKYGPGEYWIKFYSGPEPVIVHKIKINQPV